MPDPAAAYVVEIEDVRKYWDLLGVLIPLPSASELHRAIRCPPSAIFPRARRGENKSSVRGTQIHEYSTTWMSEGPEAAARVAISDKGWAATCAALDLDKVVAGRKVLATEVTYAYDLATGTAREAGRNLNHKYVSPPGAKEIFGTADAVFEVEEPGGELPPGALVVADLKTGTDVEPAARNAQLKFAALCLMRLRGVDRVAGEIVFVEGDGRVWVDRAVYSAEELAIFAQALAEMARSIALAVKAYRRRQALDTQRGAHCKYCPGFEVCPDQGHLARMLAQSPSRVLGAVPGALGLLTPEEAGQAFARLKEVKILVLALERQLYTYIDNLGDELDQKRIPLPDGSEVKMTQVTRDRIDPEVALREILRLYGQDVADKAVEKKFTKVALKNALAELALDRKISVKKLMDAAIAAMATAKGVAKVTHTQLKIVRPNGAESTDEPDE